jgi:NADPH2:quinone reductase
LHDVSSGSPISRFSASTWFYLSNHPESARPAGEGALKAVSAGLVNLHTDILPLEEAPEAHRRIEAGQVNGRILLAP